MAKDLVAKKKNTEKKDRQRIKVSGKTRVVVITAVVLFLITFFVQFIVSNVLPPNPGEVTDWKFVCNADPGQIEGDLTSYKQATGQHPVSAELGAPYMRLQYTFTDLGEDMRLVLKTAYNPIRIVVDGEVLLEDGYGDQSFTGRSYQSVLIRAGAQRTVDVYLYAPLAFSFEAYSTSLEMTPMESFFLYAGFGLSIAAVFVGMALFILSLFLATQSKHLRRLLMLSVTVLFGGILAILYACGQATMFFVSQYWFFALFLSEILLMILTYMTILICCDKVFKNMIIWIPVVILCAAVPLFATSWAIRVCALMITAAQLFIAFKSNHLLSMATTSEVPHVGVIRGLLLYAAIIGVYNTFALFLGIRLLSGYLFYFSIVVVCLAIFVVYCRQIVYLDIKKYERLRQLYTDSAWIEDITGLIAKMFLQKDEVTFLVKVTEGLSDIIEKNATLNDETVDVHGCAAVRKDDLFTEVYNAGIAESCDYESLYDHLKQQPQKLMMGNSSVDMLFQMEGHSAVVHFENISCGVTSGIKNIIKTAYLNLFIAYQNLNLKKDVTDIQEELFINLATVVEQKYEQTKNHLIVVSALSYELCKQLGMSDEKAQLISLAAMTHDIGKISVPETILEKKGPLTESEFEQMKQHTQTGFNILSLQKGAFFETAAMIALQHHENFDGTGYLGLRGREIIPAARLVRVIDVVDALLSERSYKDSWTVENVKQYIENGKGTLFDPAVVEAFLACADSLIALREYIIKDEH